MKNETDNLEIKKLEEQLALVDAHKAGKAIQCRITGGKHWHYMPDPHWDWQSCEYRVKPAPPRELWAIYTKDDIFYDAFDTPEDADDSKLKSDIVARFIEVKD